MLNVIKSTQQNLLKLRQNQHVKYCMSKQQQMLKNKKQNKTIKKVS